MLCKRQKTCSLKKLMMKNSTLLLLLLPLLLSSCGTNKIIYIADTLTDCEGVVGQKCLQVKENKEDEWTLLSQPIEGFDHKEGFMSKIEVNVIKIKNPSFHSSSVKYKLVKIIYQEKIKADMQTVSIKGKWKVSKLIGIDSLTKSPTLNIDLEAKKMSGNAGCNNYGGSFKTEGNELKFDTPFATKMYCSNMKIEKAFFECLQNAAYYQIENGKLKLFSSENIELLECHSITN